MLREGCTLDLAVLHEGSGLTREHGRGQSTLAPRQQAIDYGIEPSEVDRYVVLPGQACSYMIGQLRILEMRDRARRALGDEFSLKVSTGTTPLDLLEQEVERYVRKN